MSNVALKVSTSAPAEPKFTAAQVEADCPARLRAIAKEVAVRLKKAQTGYRNADDQMDAIKSLMEEAKALCDNSAFKIFQQLFCPQLKKSRGYEVLAIASGKKSIEETRESTRKRVAKYRTKKAAESNSATVTENLEGETSSAPPEDEGLAESAPLAPTQTPQPAEPRSRSATGDRALTDFSARVIELIRTTSNKNIERFVKTSVKADQVARLGKFLTDIANLKKSRAVEQMPMSPDNGAPSAADAPLNLDNPALKACLELRT